MSGVATAIGVGAIGGAVIGGISANKAADTQAQAAEQAAQLQYQEFQQQQANQQPWLDAGKGALPQLSSMASTTPQFTQADFLNNMDPAYQFDLQQGQQALERSAAAQGGLQSGGTLKALTQYAQGQASNEYQNAYNRYMNNQNTQFNRLASLAGIGQTAGAQMGQAGENMAGNVGNIMTGAANAQGAAAIAQGNAYSSGLSTLGSGIGNNLMANQFINRYGSNGGYGAASLGSSLGDVSAPVAPYQSPIFGTLSGD
jgi:hypothetical protein